MSPYELKASWFIGFKPAQRITNLSVQTQILVVGRHLENRRPNLCSLSHRGLVDGGGEKWDVVVDIWRRKKKLSDRRRKLIMFSFPDRKYVINSATTLLTVNVPVKI